MNWCCPSREVDEAYRHADALSQLRSPNRLPSLSQASTPNALQQTHSHSVLPTLQKLSESTQEAQSLSKRTLDLRDRNSALRRHIEGRKVDLWGQVNRLDQRAELLRQNYLSKECELQSLVEQINRYC